MLLGRVKVCTFGGFTLAWRAIHEVVAGALILFGIGILLHSKYDTDQCH